MKMKSLPITISVCTLAIFTLASCGGAGADVKNDSLKSDSTTVEEAPKPKFEDVCKGTNAMSMTIKGYKFHMTGNFAYETANFEVKQSTWTLINDSNAQLTLMNYSTTELVGDRKDDQIDVSVVFRTSGGKKIENGTTFMTSDDPNHYVQATMLTSKGKVWFNWLADMPEVGTVKINFVDADHVCGTFKLASEKPTSDQIGTVRLNGDFVVGK